MAFPPPQVFSSVNDISLKFKTTYLTWRGKKIHI